MLKIEVTGSPIGGEDARTPAWIGEIASAASVSNIILRFTIEQGRKVDLDNLVRPALTGLQRAGLYSRGFPELSVLTAIKEIGSLPSLVIESGQLEPPTERILELATDSSPPSGSTKTWIGHWMEMVGNSWGHGPIHGPAWLAVEFRSTRSLVDQLKPVIDGLEPFLGRDPAGHLSYCPNDHLLVWLRAERVSNGPRVRVCGGRFPIAGNQRCDSDQ